VGDGVDWGVGFVVVAAVARVVECAVEETGLVLRWRKRVEVLLSVVSPVGVVDLFLYESTEIHSRVELICLCSWI
jgi:hypothetical protein